MDVTGTVEIRYRPTVDVEESHELVDVQELLLVLDQEDGPVRLAEIGRKRLPPPDDDGASPNWGYVRRVVEDVADLDELGDWTYRTAGQGTRHQSATVVAAQGRFRLTGSGRDTALHLEVDPEVDDQRLLDQLGVTGTATYAITVKNPRAGGDAGLGDDERATYPDDLQDVFDGNRWAGADPVALLDHEGAEFLLVPGDR